MQIKVESVTKRYGDLCAVNELSFGSPGGEVVGLLGSNGAGKTTTVRLLLGLLQPDAGTVSVTGAEGAAGTGREVGYAPQATGLQLSLTVRDNIRFWAGISGIEEPDADDRAATYVERLDLGHRLGQRVANLSGGEQRKVQLLTAVLHEPRLLVLDEPTAFLDVPSRRAVVSIVREIADRGCTVLYSTHVLTEAEELCDSIVLLDRGRCLYRGATDPFIANHAAAQLAVRFDGPAHRSLVQALHSAFADVVASADDEFVVAGGPDDDHGTLLRRLTAVLDAKTSTVASLRIVQRGLESAVVAAVDASRAQSSDFLKEEA